MQFAPMIDRTPGSLLCCNQDASGALNLGIIRPHPFHNRADLRGMDTPHPEEAEPRSRQGGILADSGLVAKCHRNVVHRYDTVCKRGRDDVGLCPHEQGMLELQW